MQWPSACSWYLFRLVGHFWGPGIQLPEGPSSPLSSCIRNASYPLAAESRKSCWQHQLPFYGTAAFLKHNCAGTQMSSCWNCCSLSVNKAKIFFFFNVFLSWVCKSIFRNPTERPFFVSGYWPLRCAFFLSRLSISKFYSLLNLRGPEPAGSSQVLGASISSCLLQTFRDPWIIGHLQEQWLTWDLD